MNANRVKEFTEVLNIVDIVPAPNTLSLESQTRNAMNEFSSLKTNVKHACHYECKQSERNY